MTIGRKAGWIIMKIQKSGPPFLTEKFIVLLKSEMTAGEIGM
jgi:hypothetical protein